MNIEYQRLKIIKAIALGMPKIIIYLKRGQ